MISSPPSCHVAAGDWLQGPYVYALYQHYGYDKGDIGRLFIAGFGSSMVFGTITWGMVVTTFEMLLIVHTCSYPHSRSLSLPVTDLNLGPVVPFDALLLPSLRPPSPTGLVANVLVTDLNLGPVAPFDAASVLLAGGMAVIVGTWSENYGDSDQSHGLLLQFQLAYHAIASDEKIAILGAIQSLFEASMYTFVFLWTPALAPSQQAIPHGFIFSLFMLASMLGSSLASRLMGRAGLKVEVYMQAVFAISSLSLLLPCIVNVSRLCFCESLPYLPPLAPHGPCGAAIRSLHAGSVCHLLPLAAPALHHELEPDIVTLSLFHSFTLSVTL
ncbi:unnamed protein product [Closterium sp. NIES-54]